MRTIRFDCRGRNRPAYGCNVPGDNTGEYVTVEEYNRLREVVDRLEDQWRTRSPTQEAYDAVCKARTKWQERSEAAEKAACHWDAGQTECGHPEIPGMADDDLSEYCPYCGGSLEVWVTMREGK